MITIEQLYIKLNERYGSNHRVCVTRSLCNGVGYVGANENVPTDDIYLSIGNCTTYYVYLSWRDYYPSFELLCAEIDKQLMWWAKRLSENKLTQTISKEEQVNIIAKQLLENLMKGMKK